MTGQERVSTFETPGSAYRCKPFWAWNGRLDPAELRRQVRVFQAMGMGGFFMHARVGLDTPYLSDEWFDMIRACIDEAVDTGTEAWLYDEDRWPSGAAGGLVTRDERYRIRQLRLTRTSPEGYRWPEDESTSFVFGAVLEDDVLTWYKRLGQKEDLYILPQGAEILQFDVTTGEPESWFNDQTYLDTMNPEAVAKFIEVTHEAYRREVGQHFGGAVPGIFTDEPNCRHVHDQTDSVSWTPALPERFSEAFGYDITEKLPELWFDVAETPASRARYHFHVCKTRLFVDAFSRLIGDWCERNNLLHTGHVLYEEPQTLQSLFVGSAMQFYPWMQAPGIDILTQFHLGYMTAKQCSSVARQTGRKWVLSELYGCTGWQTTFETYKHSGDWQAALGITLRCPHLAWYTMAGEAKRDYPAAIDFHSPWWRRFAAVEDYFARVNVLLTEGEPVCDVAVVHSIESEYLDLTPPAVRSPRWRTKPDTLKDVTEWLLGGHHDFDFVDEHLMVEFDAAVDRDDAGPFLRVGAMRYRAVVVPPMRTIRSTTLDRLEAFAQAGGKVVFAGDPIELVDAEPSGRATTVSEGRRVACQRDALGEALSDHRRVSLRDPAGGEIGDLLYQFRRLGEDWALFVVNTNRETGYDAVNVRLRLDLPRGGQAQVWDASDGRRYKLPSELTYKSASFKVDIPASGSRMIVVTGQPEELPVWPMKPPVRHETPLEPNGWAFLTDDRNVLALDRCDARTLTTGKLKFSQSQIEVIELDDALRDLLGMARRGGHMVQPWVSKDQGDGPSVGVRLTYKFNVKAIPTTVCHVALEQPNRWTITLNDHSLLTATADGWWVDPAIRTIPVEPTLFKRGRNTLVLEGTFDRRTDLEIIYLLGTFGVETDGKNHSLIRFPNKLQLGSWVGQGLPFYSGNVTYRTQLDLVPDAERRYVLAMGRFEGVGVEVSVNGAVAGVTGWPDYRVDVTDGLTRGRNTIDITVLGSRRNAFGPFHLDKLTPWTGPAQFRRDPENWRDAMHLLDYGMIEPPRLLEL